MQGVIFNLFERVVTDELGEHVWAQVVDGAGGRGEYVDEDAYGHEELLELVAESAIALSRSPDETLVWFGRRCMPLLAERYPFLFHHATSTFGFVRSLNNAVYPEISKRFPGATVPAFDLEHVSDDTVIIGYASYRDLCRFAEGLLLGTADHYAEAASVEHFHCQRNGDARCAMLLRLVSPDRPT